MTETAAPLSRRVGAISEFLHTCEFSPDKPNPPFREVMLRFPAATLEEFHQALAVTYEIMTQDMAEATPEELAAQGFILDPEEARIVESGAPFPGVDPSLNAEAAAWLDTFERHGARVTYSRSEGFGFWVSDYRSRTYPDALMLWLEVAEWRQPGLTRRVREMALGFDELAAGRAEVSRARRRGLWASLWRAFRPRRLPS